MDVSLVLPNTKNANLEIIIINDKRIRISSASSFYSYDENDLSINGVLIYVCTYFELKHFQGCNKDLWVLERNDSLNKLSRKKTISAKTLNLLVNYLTQCINDFYTNNLILFELATKETKLNTINHLKSCIELWKKDLQRVQDNITNAEKTIEELEK